MNIKALTPEMEAPKVKPKVTWISDDFEQIAKSYQLGVAELKVVRHYGRYALSLLATVGFKITTN